MWIISINGEEPIKYKGALYEINFHQNTHGKSKVNTSLFIRKRYQRTYLEDIIPIFDQVRPVVSHLEVNLPEKPLTPNNIGEFLKGTQRKF